ncbi:MAG: acid--CoA ligase [Hyphomicrobiales bacterium]|nr:MAG: acid--CoA ligase [Hyphomicrobiales bacterium]
MAIRSIASIINDLATEKPDAVAITVEEQNITRLELELTTNKLARAYQKLGVKAGDFATIMLPNSIEFYQACIALWKLGATPQPVSSRLPRGELKGIIELAKPTLLIGSDDENIADCPSLPIGYTPDANLSDDRLPDITSRYYKAMTSGGSTGRPKLIISEFQGELDTDVESVLRITQNETHLVPGPLYHNAPFGFSMDGLLRGNHLVVMKKFNAEECLNLLHKYQVRWVFMVPTMMQRIWKLGAEKRATANLDNMRIVLHTAGPCPAWLKQEWIDWLGGEKIHELYGGTEATGVTWITGTQWLTHKGSVGKIEPKYVEAQIKIVDEDGKTVPIGTLGEVYFLPDAGQGSTYHYLGAEADSLTGGWESIGDLGHLDDEGYLYLSDRKKDLIVSGGANIYPAEVEAAIDSHPSVLSCAVVGVPHEDLGQVVHAVVESVDNLSETTLQTYLEEFLVRYKIPRTIDLVDKPVRSDAGKVRRSNLADAKAAS